MLRFKGLILGLGIVAGASAGNAWALSPMGGSVTDDTAHMSLIIQVKPMTERQKCHALNRCRQKYTHCYNKLERQHKIAEKDKVCVPPYQKCINASFSGFDFFFTRWFDPSYLDCKQYPG